MSATTEPSLAPSSNGGGNFFASMFRRRPSTSPENSKASSTPPSASQASFGTTTSPKVSANPSADPKDVEAIAAGHVNRDLLSENLGYRVAFARAFIGFTVEDGKALNAAFSLISPQIEAIIKDAYAHLFRWDYTKQPFLGRNIGFDGKLATSLEKLMLDHPQILYRKRILEKYVAIIFGSDYEDIATYEYMDRVGQMHTGLAGFKHREKKKPLHVDLMACSLMLGWLEDVVITVVMKIPDTDLILDEKIALLRAFNRIVWIQQDLFQRWYIRDDEEARFNLSAQNFAARG